MLVYGFLCVVEMSEIDWCKRLRGLASGKITGEIPTIEYALAADEIERLQKLNNEVINTECYRRAPNCPKNFVGKCRYSDG